MLAGILQVLLGLAKAGVLGDFVPNSVIKGMLAAIGIILILKQFPHLLGYDHDFEGNEGFEGPDHENTFLGLLNAFNRFTPAAVIIGGLSLCLLMLWESDLVKRLPVISMIPGPLIVVLIGIGVNGYFLSSTPGMALQTEHLVALPVANNTSVFLSFLSFPDFSQWKNPDVWIVAITLAIVASLETLLSIEAIDKLDPFKRVTPNNRELLAQGAGNAVSGLLGGLPVTSVIVRSSANVNAGARSKLSTVLHGLLLLVFVATIPGLLNRIPLSALAAILIFTGYKLAKWQMFREFYSKGIDQFVPFCVTIISILFTDLLTGIIIGIFVGLFFVFRSNFKSSIFVINDDLKYLVRLRKDVSFLNKPLVRKKLESVPEGSYVIIDATRADFIDKDVIDTINEFLAHAHLKNIQVEVKKSIHKPIHLLFRQQITKA